MADEDSYDEYYDAILRRRETLARREAYRRSHPSRRSTLSKHLPSQETRRRIRGSLGLVFGICLVSAVASFLFLYFPDTPLKETDSIWRYYINHSKVFIVP